MRYIRHIIKLLLISLMPLATAQAADYRSYAPSAPVAGVPVVPVPEPYSRARWGLIPDTAYAPISPLDYSLTNTEYYRRIQNAAPDCCYHTFYVPDYYR